MVRFAEEFFLSLSFLGMGTATKSDGMKVKNKYFHERQRIAMLALNLEVIDLITAIDPR
jgi:hypothetical protein